MSSSTEDNSVEQQFGAERVRRVEPDDSPPFLGWPSPSQGKGKQVVGF